MAEDFLTAETQAPAEKKTRKRGPMPEAQKEKIRASNKAARERLNAQKAQKAPKIPNVKTGATAEEAEEMRLELQLAAAQAKIKESAISEDNRLMVHQEIKVDVFNTIRRFVELTPSMCRVKNCSFDAAIEAGATSWGDAPVKQQMGDETTFGDRLIELRKYHETTAHTVQQVESHIMTAAEVNKRQWNPGQSIKNEFLTGAK